MTETYTISDLAKEFDITTRTIRFYEEKGYINPKRNGTQRVYDSADRTSLRLILRGKRLGLSLEETADMIRMYSEPGGSRKQLKKFISRIGEKRTEMELKRMDIQNTLDELKRVEERARATLKAYTDSDGRSCGC